MSENTTFFDWSPVEHILNDDDEAQQAEIARQRLRLRAHLYAAPKNEITAQEGQPFLIFRLADERYAVDVLRVRAVRALGSIARVPGIPPFYRGVVNIRGQILSVLDLRLFFNPGAPPADLPPEIIIIGANQLEIGLLAHDVEGTVALPSGEIDPLEQMQYARGITGAGITVLEIEQLFADSRLIVGGAEDYLIDNL